MNCEHCEARLLKQGKFCDKCKFNDDITISQTNAKKTYKLTDDDFTSIIDDVYRFEFRTSYGYGTRYLISELEKWIKNDSECSLKDRRYAALFTIQKSRLNTQGELQRSLSNKMVLKELLIDAISKSCQVEFMDEMKYLIDNDYYIRLNDYLDDNTNIVNTCNELVPVIESRAKALRKVNNTLKSHYKQSYNKRIKFMNDRSWEYRACMIKVELNQKMNVDKLIEELNLNVENNAKIERADKLEKLLKEENILHQENGEFYEFIRNDKRYKQYVDNNTLPKNATLDVLVKKISKSVVNKNNKNKRKVELYHRVSTNINIYSKYLSDITTNKIYEDYINKGKEKIDVVINLLIEENNKLRDRDDRKNTLETNIINHKIAFNHSYYDDDIICKKYIDDDVDLETTLELLKEKYGLIRIRTNDNDKEIADMKEIIKKFDESDAKERIINNFYGDALTFLSKHCRENNYKYNRLDKNSVQIKKKC